MAITAADIHNQSFSIDRKGYDVDEVDVFLEHVADEIDALNAQIAQMENQFEDAKFDGFDTPARVEEVVEDEPEQVSAVDADLLAEKDDLLAEKDERIADLERQLEAKKADDNAIAQALIIAQRSADEVLANANAQAASTIKDAEDEARRILDKAEADKQRVMDAIRKLEDDREDAREEYRDLLTDYITDATRKLAEIGEKVSLGSFASSAHARVGKPAAAEPVSEEDAFDEAEVTATGQAPINADEPKGYATPQAASGAVAVPATPKPSGVEKDLSGFGDADDDFEFEEID